MKLTIIADKKERLDVFLSSYLKESRNQIIKVIKEYGVLVDNKLIKKPSFIICENSKIYYEEVEQKKQTINVPKDNIKIDYVYKDNDLAIINKQRGIVVHPSCGHKNDTLVNYLFKQDDNYSFSKEEISTTRPGIVHRIDKDTQGLLVVAYNTKTMDALQKQIQENKFHREYLALVKGKIKDKYFKVDAPLNKPNHSIRKAIVDATNGKNAVTHFELISQTKEVSLLKCKLETGRTHQIRAHLSFIGYPVIGDNLYNGKYTGFKLGQCLCAYKINFIHPKTKKEMIYYAPIDSYFKSALISFYKK